ncbi:MAG: ABC transporter ATP-binding protein [Firmicutes bacterium]|nr:ABC transporter ATP-binding protein [Bacillota bacterium]
MGAKQILWDFIKEHKWRYLAGIVFLFITSFITSLIPKIIGLITDSLNDRMPVSVINRYLVILIAAAVGAFVFRFIWRYFLVGNCRYLECYLREKLFKHLQTLPASFYDNNKTGDLVAYAINDIQAIRRTFGFGFTAILDGVVVNAVSILIMVKTINPILTIMALAPAPLIVFILYKLRKKIRERFAAVQKAFAEISEKVQENISGIRIIKAFAQEEEEVKDFVKYSQARVDTHMELTRISAALGPVTQLFFGLSLVFFIIYGSGLVTRGIISLGDYVAFNSYIMVIMGPIVSISRIVEVWQRGIASVGRLDKIFCEKGEESIESIESVESVEAVTTTEETAAETAATTAGKIGKERTRCSQKNKFTGSIIIRNLDFTYPGSENKALKGINLKVREGETLGILGKTGSGKTTLANLLLRLYNVEDGHIFIGGRDINHIPVEVLRENMGYVPQDNFLFSTTIRSNIEFFRPVYAEYEIEQAAKMAGIYGDILSFSEGFETVVGERGVTLSGGQKQRVSIARALIKNPAILILDDSLSAVDTKTEEEILKNIKKVLENRTGIIISHRVSTVRYANQIVFMDEGQIVERGTHEELMEMKGMYYNLYKSQVEQNNDVL